MASEYSTRSGKTRIFFAAFQMVVTFAAARITLLEFHWRTAGALRVENNRAGPVRSSACETMKWVVLKVTKITALLRLFFTAKGMTCVILRKSVARNGC